MKKPVSSIGIKLVAVAGSVFLFLGPAEAQLQGVGGAPSTRLGPRPVEETPMAPIEDVAREEPRSTSPQPRGSATVHLASYRRRSEAEAGWDILSAEYPSLLGGQAPILREVDLGARGLYIRLLAGPLADHTAAEQLCADLRVRGAYCAPADLAGAFLPHEEWD